MDNPHEKILHLCISEISASMILRIKAGPLFISLLFAAIVCQSQNNLYQFTHLTTEQGLSQNKVTAIIQDKYGFMWFGTNNGLNRFDGYNMQTFYHWVGDSTSLSHNHIESLFEDSKGRLWVGTDGGGLNCFDYFTLKFKQYENVIADSASISSNSVYCIFENPAGILWIGTKNGLNRFDPVTEKFTRFYHTKGCTNCIASNSITSIYANSPNHLWIASYGGGVTKFDMATGSFTVFSQDQPASILDNNVWAIYEDAKGKVWIGAESGALNVYHQNTGKFFYYGYEPDQMKNKGENLVRKVVPGLGDDIWIASASGGLYQLNHTLRYFREYKHNLAIYESLSSNSLSTLYKSADNILWIGVVNGGVDRINLNQKPFFRLTQITNEPNSLCNNAVNGMMQDSEGNHWFATDNGLTVADVDFKTFTHYFEKDKNARTINHNTVTCLYEARNGEIWIGTSLGGINIYNKKSHQFKYLVSQPGDSNSLTSNSIRTICEDGEGNFWIGTKRGGLNKYNPETQKFERHGLSTIIHKNLNINDVAYILPSKDNKIYIATHGNGLNIYNCESQTVVTFVEQETNPNSLSSNQVNTLFFDSDSVLWIGTTQGLNQFDSKNSTFKRFSQTDGLPDNMINSIIEDPSKNLWVSTNNGITKFNKTLGSFTNYYKSDGLQSNQFNENSVLKDKNGQLFFGGINGVSFFYPDSIYDFQTIPKLNFTGLSVLNQTINVGDSLNHRVLLTKPIYETDTLHLSYKESVFTLYFSSHDYIQTKNINYRYRLLPSNPQWIDLGTRNFISFHNLPFGKHTLEIQASFSSGKWNFVSKMMTINIAPPFWKTLSFKIILLSFFLLGVLLFINLRTRNIKKQKTLLEKLVFEKTMDLNEINTILEEKQAELEMQHEEIVSQRDLANEQKTQIESQNQELELHRQHLEFLVEQRTDELVTAKEEAEKADMLKTAFLANMSHEIRTPMNAILGFIDILDDTCYTEEERKQFKKLINSSGQTLIALINDIIDIAKIESGQIDISLNSFELAPLVEELKLLYEKKVLENNSSVEIHIDTVQPVNMNSDLHRINQVMVNLLDNAIKFTETGQIWFGYKLKAREVLFFVKDTGIGISEESQAYIFERFRKIENANSKLYRGAGLGLTISKHIVELLGGRIWVESEFGKGTTFFFTIPFE